MSAGTIAEDLLAKLLDASSAVPCKASGAWLSARVRATPAP